MGIGSDWAVAGFSEEAFGEGWDDTVPSYPSYRVLHPSGGVCRLVRPCDGVCVLQVRLFFHVERPPVPAIQGRVDAYRWVWTPDTGWRTLQHRLPPGSGLISVHLSVPSEAEPWFEVRVVEIRLLRPDDPRVLPGILS